VRASLSEGKERLRFLDASWHLDKTRSPHKEFVEEHIKGAVRFDIDAVADPASGLPHMCV
jgi:thiosulfate/3-mercaptopyruvate sulfurtransferase